MWKPWGTFMVIPVYCTLVALLGFRNQRVWSDCAWWTPYSPHNCSSLFKHASVGLVLSQRRKCLFQCLGSSKQPHISRVNDQVQSFQLSLSNLLLPFSVKTHFDNSVLITEHSHMCCFLCVSGLRKRNESIFLLLILFTFSPELSLLFSYFWYKIAVQSKK